MPQEFFTVILLGSFAGLIGAVYLLVLFSKPLLKAILGLISRRLIAGELGDFIIQLYAAVIALSILLFVIKTADIGLAIINSVLVALAATGVHETIRRPLVKVKKEPALQGTAEPPVDTTIANEQ